MSDGGYSFGILGNWSSQKLTQPSGVHYSRLPDYNGIHWYDHLLVSTSRLQTQNFFVQKMPYLLKGRNVLITGGSR